MIWDNIALLWHHYNESISECELSSTFHILYCVRYRVVRNHDISKVNILNIISILLLHVRSFIESYHQTALHYITWHYNDVKISTMASQITNLTIVYSTVYAGTDQIKHQSSASLACVKGIHRWPVNSPHKGPVTRKIFPFDDVIMKSF